MNYILPFVTYNAINSIIISLSTSLTSTQNVFKFIINHADSDYLIYQHQLETTDLHNKLNITIALIKDIIRKHCYKKNIDVEKLIDSLIKPDYEFHNNIENDFTMINLINDTSVDISEPIKMSLLSTLEIINKINGILEKIQQKILAHQNSYFKSIIKINIHHEVNRTIHLTNIFNSRLEILFNILQIYSISLKI
jgi:hypothetical protein